MKGGKDEWGKAEGFRLITLLGNQSQENLTMTATVKTLTFIGASLLTFGVAAEQTFKGKINKLQINNYSSGAVYVILDGASFNECNTPTNWCAIDLSLPAGNQMYSAVLAAKMAGKEVSVTSNSCWSTNYARCWKVEIDD